MRCAAVGKCCASFAGLWGAIFNAEASPRNDQQIANEAMSPISFSVMMRSL
jgi:hypothetical protein